MSLIERGATLLLGRKVDPPSDIPAEMIPRGVVLREGKLVPYLGGLFGRMGRPAAAVTLGRTIVVSPEARLTRSLLVHELTHVRQWREDVFFPVRYTLATLRHGYVDNPYEVEARHAAADTAAPRSGSMT